MKWEKLKGNQLRLFTWWGDQDYDAVIADGAVRSGKSLCMSCAFVFWAMTNFNKQQFAVCGKTIEALRRNVIIPLFSAVSGVFDIEESVSRGYFDLSQGGKTNRFYLFSGKDEGSYMLIQGITLAGVLFDETALMPESFVNQALARCSVPGSKFWFNCNPSHPEHWFKKNWIDKAHQKRTLYLKFLMDDNPSLSGEIKSRYKKLYSGVFYDRYILGKWVRAQGRVYPMFDENLNITDILPDMKSGYFYVSVDYGTVNPFSAGLWHVDMIKRKAVRIREYYHDSRKCGIQLTDEEYFMHLSELIGDTPVTAVIVDPSAASFITCLRRHGNYLVRAAENAVADGIRTVSSLLRAGNILFHRSCADSIREFSMYGWDENSAGDIPLKEHDHAMDDIRYFCSTVLRRIWR